MSITYKKNDRNARNIVKQPQRFDPQMYHAALAHYGLPSDYAYTFKQKTYEKDGEERSTLVPCEASVESARGLSIWVQVNRARAGVAIKKAKIEEIRQISNVTLDFEYPTDPEWSHIIASQFLPWLIEQGWAEPGTPIEDSGAGNHIVIPIPTIQIAAPEDAKAWNNAVSMVVKQRIQPAFDQLVQEAGIKMDLGGFNIDRVLSVPGTWRPYRPDKHDCDALKAGYLRRWLDPYTDGRCPERRECAKLANEIGEAYIQLKKEQAAPKEKKATTVRGSRSNSTDQAAWLEDYAARHPNENRSDRFQSLVSACYLKFGEEATKSLGEKINEIAGEKYNGRLNQELERSLGVAKQARQPDSGREAPSDENDGERGQQESQASILRRIALEHIEELFRTPGGESYARIRRNGHLETIVVNERKGKFRQWLIHLYGKESEAIPNATALSSAIGAIDAEAQFGDHKTIEVHLRIAHHNENIYLDLANEKCEVVEIDAQGWRIISNSPVCFKHPTGMEALPAPRPGGSIHDLRKFINVKTDDDMLLLEACAIGFFHPKGPYAITNLHGERGAAKSTAAKVLRGLIDPSIAPLRKTPEDGRTLAVLAHNNHVVAFDNLSSIPAWLSDGLCRLSNGAGDSYRKNYTDDEEVLFNATRPIILNGIEEVVTRGDLLDRCITVGLPAIPEEARKDELTFWQEYNEQRPYLLGALLDCVSLALRNFTHTKLSTVPRMADFARWVTACESILTEESGRFLKVYRANRASAVHAELEASPLARVIRFFMQDKTAWTGYIAGLLEELNNCTDDDTTKSSNWPKTARSLSTKLSRLATSLRAVGINVEIGEHTMKGTPVTITKVPTPDGNPHMTQNSGSANQAMTQNSEDMTQNDAKFSVCVMPSEQITPDFDLSHDANDAKKGVISYVGQRKKEKKERENREEGGDKKDYSKFASFASSSSYSIAVPSIEEQLTKLKQHWHVHNTREATWTRALYEAGEAYGVSHPAGVFSPETVLKQLGEVASLHERCEQAVLSYINKALRRTV